MQATAREGPGQRAHRASSLWTLQRLRFGPHVAADHPDRGENRDPGQAAVRRKQVDEGDAIRERPLGARKIVWIGATRGRVLTCVRPLVRRVPCRGPVWEFVDQVQLNPARSRRVVTFWFSRSRLSTVAPYPPSDLPTPRQPRRPGDPMPLPGPELDRHPLARAKPRPRGPSCWPAPPGPASLACGSSCARAMSQPGLPCERPSAQPRLRR